MGCPYLSTKECAVGAKVYSFSSPLGVGTNTTVNLLKSVISTVQHHTTVSRSNKSLWTWPRHCFCVPLYFVSSISQAGSLEHLFNGRFAQELLADICQRISSWPHQPCHDTNSKSTIRAFQPGPRNGLYDNGLVPFCRAVLLPLCSRRQLRDVSVAWQTRLLCPTGACFGVLLYYVVGFAQGH